MKMSKTCNNCGDTKTPTSISYAAHQGIVATMERANKRLWIMLVILVFLLVGSNIGWMIYENSFEDIVITQENADGYNNYIGNDGDITN